jgi:hypothetical protein
MGDLVGQKKSVIKETRLIKNRECFDKRNHLASQEGSNYEEVYDMEMRRSLE